MKKVPLHGYQYKTRVFLYLGILLVLCTSCNVRKGIQTFFEQPVSLQLNVVKAAAIEDRNSLSSCLELDSKTTAHTSPLSFVKAFPARVSIVQVLLNYHQDKRPHYSIAQVAINAPPFYILYKQLKISI